MASYLWSKVTGTTDYLFGKKGPSGFGSASTAAEVADAYKDQVKGRVFLVTGANSGIGLETSKILLARGATVVMACRKPTEELKSEMEGEAREGGRAILLPLDLSSFSSIRAFVNQFQNLNVPLNVLINNAGVMMCPLSYTEQGYELQFGTNHMGHFYLTQLLLPELKKAVPSRVVTLSSAAHNYASSIPYDNLKNPVTGYNKGTYYGISKIANLFFAKELHKRYAAEGISSYSVHPGVIFTNLWRYVAGLIPGTAFIVENVVSPFMKTTPQGAATTVWVALAPTDKLQGGGYHLDCNIGDAWTSRFAKDETAPQKLWEYSEAEVKANSQ